MNIGTNWHDDPIWFAIGFIGQAVFFMRFMVQWVASERAKTSYIPISFWYLSLVGSTILLVYAIHRQEPIFLLGQLPNALVYTRNLMLIRRGDAPGAPPAPAEPRPAGSAGG